ncbi:MAG: SPOR domain-containing protein [Pseudomonadota bacterium]
MNDDSSRDAHSEPNRIKSSQENQDQLSGRRQEPVFNDFDEDEDYEAADRDTDLVAAYDEDFDEEEYEDSPEDGDAEELDDDWQVLGNSAHTADNAENELTEPWDEDDEEPYDDEEIEEYDDDLGEDEFYDEEEGLDEQSFEEQVFEEKNLEEEEKPGERFATTTALAGLASDAGGAGAQWSRNDDYDASFNGSEQNVEAETQSWPLGMIIVGVVALALLAAGGYGVIQQRAETQEEIRQLRATLATAANPAEVESSRQELADAESQNEKLRATVQRLSDENRRLGDTIASLENQLAQQVSDLYPESQPQVAQNPTPTTAPEPPQTAPPATAQPVPQGKWFVNFSSYSQRSVADDWANKLEPLAGQAIVAANDRDGRTLYRVRIVGLADRAEARKVAEQLQTEYKLPPLWVGSE